ncbi:TetR/AcrR family transcriptional regulator [Colwellia sp. MSW7]|uniref:TetR/AcrR family transcriptional regulator n=1 Tax=Colwellia maritima TaxID=2912588 RepID=A0ABS9X1Q8_9GAMM|nr:TetR/AcrR family transcriptional regulator [Colwellia maritima]MCI2284189.1 TetR/AcrR family transcriptional regulator [Colwellia maritima]
MVGIRKFDEEKVLDIAIAVFSSKGFNATTMQDLAKETGVQRGSLYNAYQNKNVLFLKVFSHYTDKFLIFIEGELQHPDAKKAFTQLFKTIENRLCGDQEKRGCFSTRAIMEAAQQCPDIHLSLARFLEGLEVIMKKRLEQAIKDQQFIGDAQSTARYLVALTRGIAVIERVYHDNARMTEIYQTALAFMPFRKV